MGGHSPSSPSAVPPPCLASALMALHELPVSRWRSSNALILALASLFPASLPFSSAPLLCRAQVWLALMMIVAPYPFMLTMHRTSLAQDPLAQAALTSYSRRKHSAAAAAASCWSTPSPPSVPLIAPAGAATIANTATSSSATGSSAAASSSGTSSIVAPRTPGCEARAGVAASHGNGDPVPAPADTVAAVPTAAPAIVSAPTRPEQGAEVCSMQAGPLVATDAASKVDAPSDAAVSSSSATPPAATPPATAAPFALTDRSLASLGCADVRVLRRPPSNFFRAAARRRRLLERRAARLCSFVGTFLKQVVRAQQDQPMLRDALWLFVSVFVITSVEASEVGAETDSGAVFSIIFEVGDEGGEWSGRLGGRGGEREATLQKFEVEPCTPQSAVVI